MTKIDHTDIEILRVLQRNGKLTVKELADRVHLSPSPTFERQRRLEREGYIERYVAKVNPKKVGNTIVVFCNIKLKQHSGRLSEEFMEAVRGIDEITECYNTSGDFDFMIKIFVRDMEHYQDFVLHKLGRIDSIGSFCHRRGESPQRSADCGGSPALTRAKGMARSESSAGCRRTDKYFPTTEKQKRRDPQRVAPFVCRSNFGNRAVFGQ